MELLEDRQYLVLCLKGEDPQLLVVIIDEGDKVL